MATTAPSSVGLLLAAKEILVTCGPGGVGKTTVAAALGATAAARHGGKVLVLTVDPARRLADAVGLDPGGMSEEVQVPPEAFVDAGIRPRGELWLTMLDTREAWDDLVRRHAPNRRIAQRILTNRLYDNIASRFVQSHEYIAMERLYQLHGGGRYDLIVVDTPPSRNALEFVEAPANMAEFFSSRFLRLLSAPYRSSVVTFASKPFLATADRILGSKFLEDIAEFFSLFQTMAPGFVERAQAVNRVLHDKRTTFAVVTTLEAAPLREAERFIDILGARRLHVGAVVLNKVLPSYLLDDGAAGTARSLERQASQVAARVADGVGDEHQVARVLAEVAESFLRFQMVAEREAEQRAELTVRPDVIASVPYFETEIHDVAGVLRLGQRLWE